MLCNNFSVLGDLALENWDGGGAIVHVGAGTGQYVQAYLASEAQGVVLVEPQRTLANTLRTRFFNDRRVSIIEAAAGVAQGRGILSVYNFNERSSLRRPTTLLEIFPGLKLIETLDVAVVSPGILIEKAGLVGNDNILILEVAGEEHQFINALVRGGQMQTFKRIIITTSTEPRYEDTECASELIGRLAQCGYDVSARLDEDPDFPTFRFDFSPLREEIFRLREVVEQREEALRETQTMRAELERELAAMKRQLEAQGKSVSETSAKLAEAQKRCREVEDALNVERKRVHTLQTAAHQIRANVDTNHQAGVRAQENCAPSQMELSAALENVRIVQENLDDLRRRYADVYDEKSKLERLIRQLTPSFQEATVQMRELNLSHTLVSTDVARKPRKRGEKTTK